MQDVGELGDAVLGERGAGPRRLPHRLEVDPGRPGVVASDVWRSVPWPIRPLIKLRMRSTDDGARTSVFCATSDEVGPVSGLYYEDCRPKTTGPAVTPQLAGELWEHSDAWVNGSA
jgi:hypothetical protein